MEILAQFRTSMTFSNKAYRSTVQGIRVLLLYGTEYNLPNNKIEAAGVSNYLLIYAISSYIVVHWLDFLF